MTTTETPLPHQPKRPVRHRAVLLVTCVALATVVSAVASLNVAIPSIARDTSASQTDLSWIIDAYSLVFAALLLPAGALGDRLGRRRALLVGLAVFGIASVAAMTRADADWLIAMRALLGLGAALVMPATLSTITGTFPAHERERAVGTWAGVAGASAVLGLLASGIVLEQWSWRSVFALNVVLAVIAIIGTVRFVPESADPHAPRVDTTGALVAIVGLGILVYSIIEAPTAGWLAVRTLGGLAAGLIVLAAFVTWELRAGQPLLDPRLFRLPGFAAGTLSLTLQFFAFFGFIFLVLQYLQIVRGDSPLLAALSLLPMAFTMMPAARGGAPRLVARIGTARTCVIGLLLACAGLVLLSRMSTDSSYWLFLAGLLPLGAGMGTAMTPATAAVTGALPAAKQGVGSAVNDLARELGGALGIAVMGSILASALQVSPETEASAHRAFVSGMQGALLSGAGAVLMATIGVLVIGRLRQTGQGAGRSARPAP